MGSSEAQIELIGKKIGLMNKLVGNFNERVNEARQITKEFAKDYIQVSKAINVQKKVDQRIESKAKEFKARFTQPKKDSLSALFGTHELKESAKEWSEEGL